ncbi:MAG: SRPBCC family protein [Polyangiaceae bacterium]
MNLDPDELSIDPRIEHAATLPGVAYTDSVYWQRQLSGVWPRAWLFRSAPSARVEPWSPLPGVLREPLLWIEDGELRCLSNVCTHRGALLVTRAGDLQSLRCPYHGRRFGLGGRCQHMPEFEGVVGFPGESDHLRSYPVRRLGPLVGTCLSEAPLVDLDAGLGWLARRLGSVYRSMLEAFESRRARLCFERRYELRANWALYCDNYLEGFHIPFVHPALNQALDFDSYRTELFEAGSLQVGFADARQPDAACFALQPDDPDHGHSAGRVAGYYVQLFPGLMLNFYPWGLSVNLVEPSGPESSVVHYLVHVWDDSRFGVGAGADLHRVELEDEAIVEQVQRGVRSSAYSRGRFSPKRERGVHHFQRWLLSAMQGKEFGG